MAERRSIAAGEDSPADGLPSNIRRGRPDCTREVPRRRLGRPTQGCSGSDRQQPTAESIHAGRSNCCQMPNPDGAQDSEPKAIALVSTKDSGNGAWSPAVEEGTSDRTSDWGDAGRGGRQTGTWGGTRIVALGCLRGRSLTCYHVDGRSTIAVSDGTTHAFPNESRRETVLTFG